MSEYFTPIPWPNKVHLEVYKFEGEAILDRFSLLFPAFLNKGNYRNTVTMPK